MTDVDLDRLADYVGGALDGTPDAAVVADLVATDPDWGRAYSELVGAEAAVRLDLASLASEPEPMPADVAARISAALSAQPVPDRATGPEPTGPQPTPTGPPGSRLRPGGGRPARRDDPSSPRRHRRRVTVALTAVAAGVIFALGAVTVVPNLLRSHGPNTATSEQRAQPTNGAQGRSGDTAAQPELRVIASGTNYGPDTVGGVTARNAPPGARAAQPSFGARAAPEADSAAVPDALRRLAEPAALSDCLAAIVRQYGGQVVLVDFARYQGTPALVVLVSGAFGSPERQWVVVVGARCGEDGAVAELLYSASVR